MTIGQTVFVIDDDQAVRESVTALVDLDGHVSASYSSAEEFLADYTFDRPGCVITDLRIEPGMSGLDLQSALQERGFTIPVIVISAYADVSTAVEVMHRGAVTLLEKNCSTEELRQAIRDALDQDQANRKTAESRKQLLQRFESLTPEEVLVMVRIVNGVLNKVIARELSISLRTAETRRHKVLEKVGVSSVPELVRVYVELEAALGEPPEDVLRVGS